MKLISLAALAMFLFTACGDQTMPAVPADFDPTSDLSSDAKADKLTKWYMDTLGEMPLNQVVKGTSDYGSPLHGRTMTLNQGDRIALKAEGNYWGYLAIYGPQPKSGKWGKAKQWDWIGWNSTAQQYTAKFPVDIQKTGTYLVVIGSLWSYSYDYSVSADCIHGPCAGGFCTTYETTDGSGNRLNNYYAINVDSYEAGKKLLAGTLNFVDEEIHSGACSELNMACTKIYQPVCSSSPDPQPTTYGNLCALKAYIRELAGQTDAAKGHWEEGVCVEPCTADYEPVCGVDGQTYTNSCVLEKSNVALDHVGECATPRYCGGWLGDTCNANEYCAYAAGQYCGAADASSVCKERPTACTLNYNPVCGCNGKTYGNSCAAASNGTGVLKNGPCKVDVVGTWSGKGPNWEVKFTFNTDGTFDKADLVAPCPADQVCFWSGIINNSGTYTYDSFSDTLNLTYGTLNDLGGKVSFPSLLNVSVGSTSTVLVETLSGGGTIEYSLQ